MGEGGLLKARELERETASGGGAPSGRGGVAGEAEDDGAGLLPGPLLPARFGKREGGEGSRHPLGVI